MCYKSKLGKNLYTIVIIYAQPKFRPIIIKLMSTAHRSKEAEIRGGCGSFEFLLPTEMALTENLAFKDAFILILSLYEKSFILFLVAISNHETLGE